MIQTGSDYSGAGAFEQAMIKAGISHRNNYACDMDKHARKTFIRNYGTADDLDLLKTDEVKFVDDIIYREFVDKKLKKPSRSDVKKAISMSKELAHKFSFYFPWNVYDREVSKKSLDIYMTSPPCQAFSLAGKRLGEKDKRGVLFYNSHEFIQVNKPRFFIFENVKGLLSDNKKNSKDKIGQTFQSWLTLLGGKSVNGNMTFLPHDNAVPYHIYWKVINAKHQEVPQNRERVFILGIRDDSDNSFQWPNKKPLKKKLKDVLDKVVDERYYLKDEVVKSFLYRNEEQKEKGSGFKFSFADVNKEAKCITGKPGERQTDNFIKIKSANKQGFEIATENDSINFANLDSETRRGRVGKDVAQTLDTTCRQGVMMGRIVGRNPENPKSRKKGLKLEQTLEVNETELCNTLTTVEKDNVVLIHNIYGGFGEETPRVFKDHSPTIRTGAGGGHLPNVVEQKVTEVKQLNPSKESNGNQPYKQNRIYGTDGVSPVLDTECGRPNYLYSFRVRKLTPRECFRLMDFPEDFLLHKNERQAYKQAGNSIVVNVLSELLLKLNI